MPNIRLCSLANTWSEIFVIRYETALSGLNFSAGVHTINVNLGHTSVAVRREVA